MRVGCQASWTPEIDRSAETIAADLGALADRPTVRAALAALGLPGSRDLIATPAAVLDIDAFDRNVAKMQARATAAGVRLRPHAKSHKCAALAHRQIAAGAVGVCCAKLAEAEALAAAGIGSILVTSPVFGSSQAARAAALAAALPDFAIVVDHVDGVAELAATGQAITVLIDVDVGLGRTGVGSPEQAAALVRAILAAPTITLRGLQAYGGHWQHVEGANARAAAVADGMVRLAGVTAAVRQAGVAVGLVTGGGTGTASADISQGVLGELQCGSYAFMDKEYRDALGADPDGAFEHALVVQSRVITDNHRRWVTLDAGIKALSTDGPPPVPATPGLEGCAYRVFGDEHGMLMRPADRALARGDRVDLIPGHIDPTLDRYDMIHAVRGEVLVDIFRIDARGASQ